MSVITALVIKIALLVTGLAIVLGIFLRLGFFTILRANGCYGFATFGFTLFGLMGILLHKNLTGVVAWGAIPWLLAILFGAIPMFVWGIVAIVRSRDTKIQLASIIFVIASMFAPIWVLLEITSGI